MNELLKKWLPVFQKYWYIPMMVIVGIALMMQQSNRSEAVAVLQQDTDERFVTNTEERVVEMLKNVEGAGDCIVTITLSSSGKKEYVREENQVLVITDKEGNQSAVVSRENAPEIAGVTVATKGAGRVSVRNDIILSVSTLLGIGTNRICVIMRN